MRVSTLMMYQQNMRGITDSQSAWLGYGEQMSTGKRVNRASDDPVAASQAVVLSQAQAQNSQYATARTFATQRVSIEEKTLSQVTTAIQSAQEKIVYAGNGTLSDDDRASLATDLEGIRDQILNLANSTDGNGRYIFAGYKTDAAPFDADGTYNGGSENVQQQVDSARTMVIGHTGNLVFDKDPASASTDADSNIFVALNKVIDALKTPVGDDESLKAVSSEAIDRANRSMKGALNNVLTVRAELGTQLNELDKLDSLGDDRALAQTQQMSNLVDVDWNETISNYTMQQTALQAAYKAFTDMQGMSLFQLNK
ncbi:MULTISPECIES: flagellar hook-associated protein FlgL [Kluyvera]|uniref:Flagellar hook-associated protein FlgL n=1 Tax=Kluyvera sichuanensis TaxID=2725494 RepID=A0ABR6RN90_9ENTR|nr:MULTISPECIES: flagellar hook-associated protein FlgL [Kluyvera]MBC1184595.1 flagellar hook-associated protein FlgL [Kluyvera sichuanensis]MBW9462839.1 flagellar hook-associated protein FlgL [Kluyvera sp. EC_51]